MENRGRSLLRTSQPKILVRIQSRALGAPACSSSQSRMEEEMDSMGGFSFAFSLKPPQERLRYEYGGEGA